MTHNVLSATQWPTKELGEVVEVRVGLHFSRVGSSLDGSTSKNSNAYRYISLRDMERSNIIDNLELLEKVHLPKDVVATRYQVQENDVLLVYRGANARTTTIEKGAEGALASSNLLILRPLPELRASVLSSFLRSHEGQALLMGKTMPSSIQVSLSKAEVERIPIPIPPMEVQDQITELLRVTETGYQAAIQAAQMRRQIGLTVITDLLFNRREGKMNR